MADTLAGLAPRQSLFDRLRAPMAFLLIAAGTVGASYYVFMQRKIDYYTNRDARLIARSAQQILRAVRNADGMVKNVAKMRDATAETDLPDTIMDVVFQIEQQTAFACGRPQGLDLAFLLISQKREAAIQ